METATTQVLIVGAGPSGLTLGLALAKWNIRSVILEKAVGVTGDPRGVFLAAGAVRILHDLGFGAQLPQIGHEVRQALFHESSICSRPFFTVPFNQNILCQEVSDAVLQSQPKLEQALRSRVEASDCCDLREGCEVVGRDEYDDHVSVHYSTKDGRKSIRCSWLVGADGKRGVVRKRFLEPTAGIRQITGTMHYEGTWIVSNLRVTIPTPETHPDFPLWHFGLSPSEVYDLFWPKGWHFCSPPGFPTACGRFGPHADRIWRHEIAVGQNEEMDAESIALGHVASMLKRDRDEAGNLFPAPVSFPIDCITVLRCQPVTFVQKVVNKWFHNRTILIGDAAHVFPPFGGQGIACGMKDAHTLAWRLSLLVNMEDMPKAWASKLLELWAAEQVRAVNDAVMTTVLSGNICNSTESWLWFLLRHTTRILSLLPPLRQVSQMPTILADKGGYRSPEAGFHMSRLNGGFKIAQVPMKTSTSTTILSDRLLSNRTSVLTLLVVGRSTATDEQEVKQAIQRARLHPSILSVNSIRHIDLGMRPWHKSERSGAFGTPADVHPSPEMSGKVAPLTARDQNIYRSRLGRSTAYAIVRPDFIVFATASSIPGLEGCLQALHRRLQ